LPLEDALQLVHPYGERGSPKLAEHLRIEERELQASGRN
jgi:hypothetical protein